MNKMVLFGMFLIAAVGLAGMVSATGLGIGTTHTVYDSFTNTTYPNVVMYAKLIDRGCTDTDGFNPFITGTMHTWKYMFGEKTGRWLTDHIYFDGQTIWRMEFFCGTDGLVDGVSHPDTAYAFLVPATGIQ